MKFLPKPASSAMAAALKNSSSQTAPGFNAPLEGVLNFQREIESTLQLRIQRPKYEDPGHIANVAVVDEGIIQHDRFVFPDQSLDAPRGDALDSPRPVRGPSRKP